MSRSLASPLNSAIAAISNSVKSPLAGIAFGDTRQRVQDGEIGGGGVGGGLGGERHRGLEPLAVLDQILGRARRLAFLGAEGAAGQHHVHDPGDADEAGDAHRPAAAEKNAALALR